MTLTIGRLSVSDIYRILFVLEGVAIEFKELEQELASGDRVAVFLSISALHCLVKAWIVNKLAELVWPDEASIGHTHILPSLVLQLVACKLLVLYSLIHCDSLQVLHNAAVLKEPNEH